MLTVESPGKKRYCVSRAQYHRANHIPRWPQSADDTVNFQRYWFSATLLRRQRRLYREGRLPLQWPTVLINNTLSYDVNRYTPQCLLLLSVISLRFVIRSSNSIILVHCIWYLWEKQTPAHPYRSDLIEMYFVLHERRWPRSTLLFRKVSHWLYRETFFIPVCRYRRTAR